MEDFSKYLMKANSPKDEAVTNACLELSPIANEVLDSNEKSVETKKHPILDVRDKLMFSPVTDHEGFGFDQHRFEDKMKLTHQDKFTELENNIEKCYSRVKENGIRDVIISANYKKKSSVLKKIDELTKKINEKVIQYKKNMGSSAPVYYARDLRFEDGMSSTETTCMRSVREICESISSYFDKEFSKEVNLPTTDSNDTNKTATQFWSKTEDIAHNYSPAEIHEALLKNIQQTTENLKELSSRIDLKQDAQNLKFKFETGKLKDISSVPSLLKTVNQLIEEGQIKHFQRFVSCQKANNEAWDLKKTLQCLNGEIDDILHSRFDSHQAELIRKYFHAEEEHGSCIAIYHNLQEELNRLRKEQKEKEATMNMLQKKYDKIKNFDKTVQAKQLIIQKLIQINGSAKSRHRQQHSDIIKMVEDKIIKKQTEITELCNKYKEVSAEELDVFLKIPIQNLNCVKKINGEMSLESELSINSLNPHFQHPGDDSLKHIRKKVKSKDYSAPENMISDIIEMKYQKYMNSERANSFRIQAKELSDMHTKIANVTETLSNAYKDQYNMMMPCLKENEEKSKEIMSELLKFQNASHTWWKQPAQHLVPSLTVDGLNIQQYIEQFSMHGELLKQMRDGATQSKIR